VETLVRAKNRSYFSLTPKEPRLACGSPVLRP
jgi:hypothetical protein